MNTLPSHWCIKRTPQNHKEVNTYFNTLYTTKNYTGNSQYYKEHPSEDFLHYPKVRNATVKKYIELGYTLLTDEQFKTLILKENKMLELEDIIGCKIYTEGGSSYDIIKGNRGAFALKSEKDVFQSPSYTVSYFNARIAKKDWTITEKPKKETMRKYTIEELNKNLDNKWIVCHIQTEEQWDKLNIYCPNMTKYEDAYKYYITSNGGYAPCKDTYYSSKSYTIIEFDQIEFPKEQERKIIGYKAPKDLFGGTITKGTIFKIMNNPDIYGPIEAKAIPTELPHLNLPKEIVEEWEAVYEELFKVGDYVVFTGEYSPGVTSAWDENRVGKVFKVTEVMHNGLGIADNSGLRASNYFKNFRKATEEEIKAYKEEENFKIGSYKIEFHGDKIKVGCQWFELPELITIQKLLKHPVSAQIKIVYTDITLELINKIIKKLS